MRVLWVALVAATSLAGCTEVPQVEGWPCVEPHERKVVSETFTFDEGRPMGNGNEGWWIWQLQVADACPPAAPTGLVDVVAKAAPALDQCHAERLGFGMGMSSVDEDGGLHGGYHNGGTPQYDAVNGTYQYASSLPDVWFGPAGSTEKPMTLRLEVTVWHLDTEPDHSTVCLEALVESATLTFDYLPLDPPSDA